ncbi:DUF7302 family protein [Nocardioides alcanivorans]|uniref:DUF7302 family protein n=1 Tax=Nocardioides alcanivorans TaxID=2897352 RepID=UPI001F2F7D45|nr:hypothetical protein [Nocardioides alcanivorans]
MARLRNKRTGVAVSCPDEEAARLGGEWERADKPAPKAPAKKAAASPKKSD